MTRFCRLLAVLSAASLLATGCGASPDPAAAPASGQAPAAQAGPTRTGLTVVPYEKLQEFLPTLDGWIRGAPKGETDTAESVSRVQVDYERGVSGLSVELMDSTMRPEVQGPFTSMIEASDAEAAARGYVKTKIAGFPAVEEWTEAAKNGEISVLVGGRYMVRLVGSTVPELKTIRDAVEKIDLVKLATLK